MTLSSGARLGPDHQRWIRPKYGGFFLPVKVLSRVFRGKFVAALRRAYARGDLDLAGATEGLRDPTQWHAFVDELFHADWVVYAKPAFGGASAPVRDASAPGHGHPPRCRDRPGSWLAAP